MKQSFTRLIFLLVTLIAGLNLQAQFSLEITDPPEAAGSFEAGDAEFYTECFRGSLSGELVNATDATATPSEICEAVTNDVKGKIAVVDRGACSFKTKALNAQNAGAIAVIICNNRASTDATGGIFGLGDDENITDLITIPTLGLSREDCSVFRSSLPLTGSIKFTTSDLNVITNVLWGDEPGQGDFTGGINEWIAITLECDGVPSEYNVWQWTENGTATGGSFSSGEITSPTGCDGAMAFDSDFHDNNGDVIGGASDPAFGSGPCPVPQIGELISPIIDLSSSDAKGVSLSFYQDARQFQSQYIVSYSIDGGTTWVDTEINTELSPNARIAIEDSFVLLPLPGAAGSDSLRIKFTMVGDYYYWIIDDIKIVEQLQNELEVTDLFYTPASAVQPAAVIAEDPFLFQIQVSNNGAADQTNVQFKAEVIELIIDQGGDLIGLRLAHSDSSLYEVIPVEVDTVLEITELYKPDLTPGQYIIRYTVTQDAEDEIPSNNVDLVSFVVTENTFSKDLDGGNSFRRNNDDSGTLPHSWACLYSINPETKATFKLDNISFRSRLSEEEGRLDGNTINVYLLEVAEEVADDFSNFNFSSDDITADGQLETIGFAEFTFPDGAGQDGLFSTPLEGLDSGDANIALETGKRYFAATNYPQQSSHIRQAYSTDINYLFTSGLLLFERWFSRFAGENGFAPVIRMDLALSTAVDETPLPEGTMTLFPNPATDFVQAQFSFEKALDATVVLASIDGKVIEYKNLSLLNETLTFNTANLPAGMYLMRVATDIGTKTEKFLVHRP